MKRLHLLPGTLCNEKLWQYITPALSHDFELVHCPIPNHQPFSEMAEYFQTALMPAKSHERSSSTQEKLHLIGFSLGGYAAAYFATRFPDSIASLTVVSNSPTVLPEQEVKQRMAALEFVKKQGYKGSSKKRLGSLLASQNRTEDNLALLQEMDKATGETGFLSQYEYTTNREDLAHSLASSPFPIQFIFAEQDPLVDHAWMKTLETNAPHITFHRTPGSGHMLPLEEAAHLSHIIKQFV